VEAKIEQFSRKWLSLLANAVIGIAALVGVITMQSSAQLGGMPTVVPEVQKPLSVIAVASFKQAAQQETQQEALRLKMLQTIPSFGFDNLIADWTFLKFLQYFGDDEARNVTGYNLSADYFDIVTRRNPRWVEIYPFLSVAVSYYQAKPEIAVQLIERGTNVLSPQIDPQAWRVWRNKGLDELLLLGDTTESARSHEMAADWVEGTPEGKKLAPMFRATADFLRRDPDSIPVRFAAWSAVYAQTNDKFVRMRARQALVKLGAVVQKDKDGNESFILPPRK
jgi:type IV secretory pathway TrbF-like protein